MKEVGFKLHNIEEVLWQISWISFENKYNVIKI